MTRFQSFLLIFSVHHPTVQAVMDFAENIVSNPVTIKLRREEESLDNIKQVQDNKIDQTLDKEQTDITQVSL